MFTKTVSVVYSLVIVAAGIFFMVFYDDFADEDEWVPWWAGFLIIAFGVLRHRGYMQRERRMKEIEEQKETNSEKEDS